MNLREHENKDTMKVWLSAGEVDDYLTQRKTLNTATRWRSLRAAASAATKS